MFVFIIGLFILVLNPEPSVGNVKLVISDLCESHHFDFINVVNLGGEFWDLFNFPMIPLTVFTRNPMLHTPLMINFDTNLLTVVFATNSSKYSTVYNLLEFNSKSKIIIFLDSEESIKSTLKEFANKKFINSIAVLAKDNTFFTFDLFPEFVLKRGILLEKAIYFEEKMKNIRQHPIRFSCHGGVPRCMTGNSPATGKQIFVGYMSRIVKNFSKFINGSYQPSLYPSISNESIFDEAIKEQVDIISMQRYFIPNDPYNSLIFRQNRSHILEFTEILVIAPSPNRLNSRLYFIKPFDAAIWMGLGIVVFYGTSFLTLTMWLTRRQGHFWYIFTDVLRLILTQPLSFHSMKRFKGLSLFFILIQGLGFIIILLYSTILGSFLTTYIYERVIKTFPDIRAANLKILFPVMDFNPLYSFEGIEENLDLFEPRDVYSLFILRDQLDQRFSFVELSDHWEHFAVPQMRFFNDQKFRKTEIVLSQSLSFININHDSLYKESLNRFIHLIKDYGLYKFWCEKVFMENLKYKVSMEVIVKTKEDIVHVLSLRYFQYIFAGWIGGLVLGIVVFCWELCIKEI